MASHYKRGLNDGFKLKTPDKDGDDDYTEGYNDALEHSEIGDMIVPIMVLVFSARIVYIEYFSQYFS